MILFYFLAIVCKIELVSNMESRTKMVTNLFFLKIFGVWSVLKYGFLGRNFVMENQNIS